jgi:phosphatidylinositol alpha-1,6-mannosyltransferase
MNILVIPTNDWVRAPGHGHIDCIAERLAERGHNVYAWYFDLYRYEQAKRRPRMVKLVRPRTFWVRDPSVFYTVNAFVQSPAMFKAIRELRIDVVINENIINGLAAFILSGRRVLKVFDFSDYFPESASVYYSNSSQVVEKMVEGVSLAVTKLNIKFSNVCVAVCYSLLNVIKTIDRTKTSYLLTNGTDTRNAFSSRTEQKQTGSDDSSDKTMIIMGVIDNWLDLMTPLKALKTLIVRYPKIRLVIIGPWRKEDYKRQVQEFVESQGLSSHVEITGYVSDRRLSEYLNLANCCIMPYETSNFSSIIRLPEKLFVYSAYGKPILSTPLPEVAALRSEHVFFYHDAAELVEAASKIMNDQKVSSRMSAKARDFAREHDFKALAERLEQILLANIARAPEQN